VILASGLKYVGLGTTTLGWVLCAILLGAAVLWLTYVRPWRSGAPMSDTTTLSEEEPVAVARTE
jgi:hypothetical protein